MKTKTWDPWIGSNYKNGGIFNKRILILGESHYGNSNIFNRRDYTQQVVKEKIGEGTDDGEVFSSSFFTKLFYTLHSRDNKLENLKELWHSVAFYNYIQEPLIASRRKPEKWMWQNSKESFKNVVLELRQII